MIFFNSPNNFGAGATSISSFTVTSSGGNIQLTVSGIASPIQFVGLTNGTTYTFTVTATNNLGTTSPSSAVSNSVTPSNGFVDSIFSVSVGSILSSNGSAVINSTVLLNGTVSPGDSLSSATIYAGAFNFATSSTYKFNISNVAGSAGSSSGWDLINSFGAVSFPTSGTITLDITAQSIGTGFSSTTAYSWTIAKGSGIIGFNANNFTIIASNFQPSIVGTFSVVKSGNNVNLVYTPFPVITLLNISSSINPFANQCINTPSSANSFTVTGNYLLGNITITPPAGFQISQSPSSGYTTSTLTLTPTSGSVNTNIYVEFVPNSATTYSGGNISVATTGASTQNVPVSGTGNATPTLSFTTSSNTTLCSGSSATINLTGLLANSTSNVNYTIGGTSGTQTTLGVIADGSGNASFSTIALFIANSGQTITINSITRTDIGFCNTVISSNNTTTLPVVNAIVTPSVKIAATANPVCNGTSVTFIASPTSGGTPAYQWTIGGMNVLGANSSTYNYSPTNGDVIACIMTANNLCQTSATAISNSINETVNQTNTINLTSAVGTNAQTLSFNSAVTNIVYTTTGVTGVSFDGLPPGVNGNWNSNIVTISGTPTLTGTFNYTVALTGGCGTVTTSGTIIVNAVTPSLGSFTVAPQTYGASPFTLTAPTSNSAGSFNYSSSNTAVATITGSTVTIVGAGSTTITATQTANGSYTTGSTTVTFTVSKANSTITATGTTSFSYNGLPQGPASYTRMGSTGNVSFLYSGTGTSTYLTSATKPTALGTYQVIAIVAADMNYNGDSSSALAFTISKGHTYITLTDTTSFTYNGLSQGPEKKSVTGSTGAATYGYAGTGTTKYDSTSVKPTAAGTYYVIIYVAADANYHQGNTLKLPFTIYKAALTITASNQSVPYGTDSIFVTSSGTYSPTGFVNRESAAVISGSVTYSTTYNATTTVATSGVTITPNVSSLVAATFPIKS